MSITNTWRKVNKIYHDNQRYRMHTISMSVDGVSNGYLTVIFKCRNVINLIVIVINKCMNAINQYIDMLNQSIWKNNTNLFYLEQHQSRKCLYFLCHIWFPQYWKTVHYFEDIIGFLDVKHLYKEGIINWIWGR